MFDVATSAARRETFDPTNHSGFVARSGTANVTLHVTDDRVTGTISEGRRVWMVSGMRTS